ncbi:MAG: DNA polymerase I [Bacteroidales bacterium]|nr:DNA polymerase I [Bacteroidales bacterium]
MSRDRLFLIDGHALIFKMYYAFLRKPMINSKGADTSILFGFTKYLLELIEKEHPTHLGVAFDLPGGTFRNEMFPEYKANRAETPQLIIDALEPLTEICQAMNIPVLMLKGFEADDVIGSAAKRFAREGADVFMVTPDKDYGQLIEEHIFQFKPGKSGGENELVDKAKVCEKYGICDPLQVIDMLAICGDAADNVPGVKGVGEVGASKLIAKYGSMESIYEHIGELSERQKGMFEAAKDHIGLSKQLVTIKTDIQLDTTLEDLLISTSLNPVIVDLFEKYEFNSLKRYIADIKVEKPQKPGICVNEASAAEVVKSALAKGFCSVTYDHGVQVAAYGVDGLIAASGEAEDFKSILEDAGIEKYGFDIKGLLVKDKLHIEGPLYDVELMHYVLNPERNHSLEVLADSMLGASLEPSLPEGSMESLFGDDEPSAAVADHSRVAATLALGEKLKQELMDAEMLNLYEQVEAPLIKVLARMEKNGVCVDVASLREFADQLRVEISRKEALVRELAGEPNLNVGSPKQLGVVLFEKMQLDPKAKPNSRGGWSTDEETLQALADRSPIIDAILDYRAAKKLLSTYIEPFPGYISPVDGRIHTTFNQALTSTGRLSSSNPNLQNIPIRTELGKEIRKAFVAQTPGWLIMSADYSQIELRIMAHLSCDAHLIAAFRDGVDVHAATASKIFDVPVAEVTPDMRRIAKTANFGIMYGISAFGLSQRLKCSRGEAKKIIDDYFASFPAVSSFISDTVTLAKENGFVETIFGRRRYIPDINSHNFTVRSLAERNAVNAPIQGSSADIIKLAMIAIDRKMQEQGMKSKMVLQIHDELLFEVAPDEVEALDALVVAEMENVVRLSIPLTVECNHGTSWLESH